MKITQLLYTPIQNLKPLSFGGLGNFSQNNYVSADRFERQEDFLSLSDSEQIEILKQNFSFERNKSDFSKKFEQLKRLKNAGFKIPVTKGLYGEAQLPRRFNIYKIETLKNIKDENFELFKRLKISNVDIFFDTVPSLKGLTREELEYIVLNKNRLFEISYRNNIENNPSYSMALAFSILLDELRSKNVGTNPILDLAKTEKQKQKLNNLLNAAVQKIRAYQSDKTYFFSKEGERIKDLSFFSSPINKYLLEKGLIPKGYSLKFEKLHELKDAKIGITYKVSVENDKKEKLFDDCALKVFKIHSSEKRISEEDKIKIANGENLEEIYAPKHCWVHGIFSEYSTAKYIEDCSKIPYENRGTGKVYGANLASGYMISKFVEENNSPLKENDFEELGLKWIDTRSENVVGGRIIDFGGILTDEKNETYKNWIRNNIFEIEL